MSRFRKLSHAIWLCQHHMVWAPKYRYRVLTRKKERHDEQLKLKY